MEDRVAPELAVIQSEECLESPNADRFGNRVVMQIEQEEVSLLDIRVTYFH